MSTNINLGTNHPFHEFENKSALELELAAKICHLLSESIINNGVASIALSGGSTPKELFKLLSQEELDWEKIIVN
jgi:6-phosphogluconolactonase